MRFLTRGRLFTVVIIVALLAVNVVALRWSSHLFSAKHERSLLRYGDRAPTLKGKSLIRKKTVELATNKRTNLILYFSSLQSLGSSTELVKYAEILWKRHKNDGLGVAAIVQKDITDLQALVDQSLISYDVIVDENRKLQEQFGLQPNENGVFVFDQQGLCRFSTRRPVSAKDLRQLVDIEFLAVDPLKRRQETETTLKKNQLLGPLPLVDARSLATTSLDQLRTAAPVHYIFFTAHCSVCSLPHYLQDFQKFRREQLKEDDQVILVFDFNFARTDVVKQLGISGIDTPAYIANQQLPELEYTDPGRPSAEQTVAVVQTDAQRSVLNIAPLNSLIDEPNEARVSPAKLAARPTTPRAAYEEMFSHIQFAAYDVATHKGKYFLSDFEGNRILVVKENLELETDFGRIGSGPGRVFRPGFLDVGPDGTIFVEDGGNERIVKFDQSGKYLGELRAGDHDGLAVGTQNELYLGQPQNGHLITVYSSSGKKLRSFGPLKKFSDVYGPSARDKDDPFKIAFNRVRLSTDREGNLYVSFMLTPLIQKYSPDGTLLFERRLEAPQIDQLMEAIQKKKHIATHGDGADARIVALDAVVDPVNGNIMVPLVNGSIYLADRNGNKITLIEPTWTRRRDGSFYPFVAGLGAKGELLVTPFPPKYWYRLVIAADSLNALAKGD